MKTFVFVLIFACMLVCQGCSGTPASVVALQEQQGDRLETYIAVQKEIQIDLTSQLEQSKNEMVELILNYQIMLQKEGDTISVEALTVILDQYRAKREQIKVAMDGIRAELAKIDLTSSQLLEIQAAIGRYITRDSIEWKDLKEALNMFKKEK